LLSSSSSMSSNNTTISSGENPRQPSSHTAL
jgi:hypothetical protein